MEEPHDTVHQQASLVLLFMVEVHTTNQPAVIHPDHQTAPFTVQEGTSILGNVLAENSLHVISLTVLELDVPRLVSYMSSVVEPVAAGEVLLTNRLCYSQLTNQVLGITVAVMSLGTL